MISKFKKPILRHLINLPGWRTDRKILVIESDDWGSIRMPSKEVLDSLIEKGYPLSECSYNSNDALETNEDIEFLLDVLSSVKDANGDPAIFTMNNIVANPDFKKIEDTGFREYYYEPFLTTLENHPNCDKVIDLYKKGIAEKMLKPQFHGREHVHIEHWMNALRNGGSKLREIFDQQMFTYYKGNGGKSKSEFLDAFGTYNKEQLTALDDKLKDGLDLFEKIWGYRSKTIIAPCYIWSRDAERLFSKYGIKLIQSGRCQIEPRYGQEKYNIIRRYTGQMNGDGLVYTIRNVTFEPSLNPEIAWVEKSLKDIATAFLWKKPAIISAHRVNFIGSIHQQNRDKNLKLLKELLDSVIKIWPGVEFMSSDQLGDAILAK